MKKKNLYWLVESAVMLALAIVLEMVSKSIVPKMAFGGQITIVSMLPIVLVGWKYGIGKGLITGFVYSLAEMIIGIADGTITAAFLPPEQDGLGIDKAILMLFLDYILAYTVIGLGSMYKKVMKNDSLSLSLGAFTVLSFRYISHILSGYILYGAWAEWFFTQEGFYSWGTTIMNTFSGNALSLVYSIVYNGFYMIPEIIITTVVAVIIGKIPQITKTKV
ncbi:MAG: energy-coupled thiamine transporter ThiT [Clostridia bacterium]|nr:energy-coupled thiamine transporter ThiT [Clostridia bacterium]